MAFFTFWFFIFILLCVTIAYSEKNGITTTLVFLTTLASIHFFTDLNLILFIKNNLSAFPIHFVWYLGVGFIFASIKWAIFVHKKRQAYNQCRHEFIRKLGYTIIDTEKYQMTPKEKEKFRNVLLTRYSPNNDGYTYGDKNFIPEISANKDVFIRWMTWWPFNLIFTLINDPFRIAFNWLYDTGAKTLQSLANNAFVGIERDILTVEDAEFLQTPKKSID